MDGCPYEGETTCISTNKCSRCAGLVRLPHPSLRADDQMVTTVSRSFTQSRILMSTKGATSIAVSKCLDMATSFGDSRFRRLGRTVDY